MNKNIHKRDIVTGLVLTAIAAGAYILALPMPGNASVFPKIASSVLALLGVLLVITSAVKMKKDIPIHEEPLVLRSMIKPLIYVAMILIYVLAIKHVGFYLSTTIILALYMFVMGIRKPSTLIITVVVVMVLIYLVFTVMLKVRLPKGIWM